MTPALSERQAATPAPTIRVAFVLPGLHRVMRGAEVAFEEVARHLAVRAGWNVTLIGSGTPRPDDPYRFIRARALERETFERWPRLPCLRSHYAWEELTFVPGLLGMFRPTDYDVTVTCSYPWTNWVLRSRGGSRRPRHVFVTQNGDWMVQGRSREYRWFGCDGLVCTNPEYYARHRAIWPSALIPNGVDLQAFGPGDADRASFGLPEDVPVVLMVSALIRSKRVIEGIQAVSQLRDAWLVVAGDGELREEVVTTGRALLGERFRLVQVPRQRMPELYRCADVCLHMSTDEPFGNIYVEAMASGIPLVAHDRDVTRWAVQEHGRLVNTQDLHSVTEAIRAAMLQRSPEDVRLRRAFAESRYAWPRIAEQYDQFLRAVVEQRA